MINYKYLFVTLLVIITIEIIYFTVIAPGLTIKKIILKSDINLSDEEIIRHSGLTQGAKFYSVNKEQLSDLLKKNIAVSTVIIEKRWPNSIKIILEGHQSVARYINSQEQLAYIDGYGSTFDKLAANEPPPPLIIGLEFTANNKIEEYLYPLLSDLEYLKKHHLQLFSLIKTITIQKNSQSYTLLASFNQFNHTVIWPSRIDPKRLYNSLVLVSLAKELHILATNIIDFRTDEIVYKTEVSS